MQDNKTVSDVRRKGKLARFLDVIESRDSGDVDGGGVTADIL